MEQIVQNASDNNLTYYASLVSGGLLIISEALPHVSKIKGNGIIQVLTSLFTNYEENKKQEKLEQDRKIQEIMEKLDRITEMIKEVKN